MLLLALTTFACYGAVPRRNQLWTYRRRSLHRNQLRLRRPNRRIWYAVTAVFDKQEFLPAFWNFTMFRFYHLDWHRLWEHLTNFHMYISGLLRQPKWGHLRDLHKAIKQAEPILVSGDPTVQSLGNYEKVNISMNMNNLATVSKWYSY